MATVNVRIEKLGAVLNRISARFEKVTKTTFSRSLDRAAKKTRQTFFLSGGPPRPGFVVNRSGRLQRSLKRFGPIVKGNNITGGLQWGNTRTPQARILEEGGVIFHPGSSGKLQVFKTKAGKTVFTMSTKPHRIVIRERAILSRGLARELTIIVKAVDKAYEKEFTKAA